MYPFENGDKCDIRKNSENTTFCQQIHIGEIRRKKKHVSACENGWPCSPEHLRAVKTEQSKWTLLRSVFSLDLPKRPVWSIPQKIPRAFTVPSSHTHPTSRPSVPPRLTSSTLRSTATAPELGRCSSAMNPAQPRGSSLILETSTQLRGSEDPKVTKSQSQG